MPPPNRLIIERSNVDGSFLHLSEVPSRQLRLIGGPSMREAAAMTLEQWEAAELAFNMLYEISSHFTGPEEVLRGIQERINQLDREFSRLVDRKSW